MPSSVSIEWNGDRIIAELTEACRAAIDDVTDDTDKAASNSHWWRNRSGWLESQIITEPATIEGSTVTGKVGYTYSGTKGVRSGFYGLFLELRFPTIRPAGDATFPTLARRIRERLGR